MIGLIDTIIYERMLSEEIYFNGWYGTKSHSLNFQPSPLGEKLKEMIVKIHTNPALKQLAKKFVNQALDMVHKQK